MSQERLNDLPILCIEKNMLKNIDVDIIINDFAYLKFSSWSKLQIVIQMFQLHTESY